MRMRRFETTCALRVRGRAADGSKHVVCEEAEFTFTVECADADAVRCALAPRNGLATHARWVCALDASTFAALRREQSLSLERAVDLAETCAAKLTRAREANDGRTLCVLACESDGRARLEIVEDGGHRLVSVLEMPFVAMDDAETRRLVSEEYESMRRRLLEYERRFGVL